MVSFRGGILKAVSASRIARAIVAEKVIHSMRA